MERESTRERGIEGIVWEDDSSIKKKNFHEKWDHLVELATSRAPRSKET